MNELLLKSSSAYTPPFPLAINIFVHLGLADPIFQVSPGLKILPKLIFSFQFLCFFMFKVLVSERFKKKKFF